MTLIIMYLIILVIQKYGWDSVGSNLGVYLCYLELHGVVTS